MLSFLLQKLMNLTLVQILGYFRARRSSDVPVGPVEESAAMLNVSVGLKKKLE